MKHFENSGLQSALPGECEQSYGITATQVGRRGQRAPSLFVRRDRVCVVCAVAVYGVVCTCSVVYTESLSESCVRILIHWVPHVSSYVLVRVYACMCMCAIALRISVRIAFPGYHHRRPGGVRAVAHGGGAAVRRREL